MSDKSPLTEEEISTKMEEYIMLSNNIMEEYIVLSNNIGFRCGFLEGIRFAEKHHGIGEDADL